MSCWGLWQSATSFYPFTSCFVFGPFSQFGSLCMEGMRVCLLCLCVCVLNLDHAICLRTLLPQHQTPPAMVFTPPTPISALVCLPQQRLVHNLPTSSYFTLGEEHRTRVRRLPSSHLWDLSLPQKHTRAQTHSQHMDSVSLHCLIYI